MDRAQIMNGLTAVGPCTTRELIQYLCGDSPTITEYENIRTKLKRMRNSGTIKRVANMWAV